MTAPTAPAPTAEPAIDSTTDPTTDSAVDPRCAVCAHDLADHDAISLRFCRATQAQAMTRNCICVTA